MSCSLRSAEWLFTSFTMQQASSKNYQYFPPKYKCVYTQSYSAVHSPFTCYLQILILLQTSHPTLGSSLILAATNTSFGFGEMPKLNFPFILLVITLLCLPHSRS